MKPIDLDKITKWSDYLINKKSDKNVIVVGNSPTLLSKDLGKVIDSHDIVIRLNKCVTDGFEKHTGQKINIWATTRNDFHENWYPKNISQLKEIWLRTPNTKKDLFIKDRETVKHIPYICMFKGKNSVYKRMENEWKLQKEPCTGFFTILTAQKIYKKISIVGFSFYTDKKSQDNDYEYYLESERKIYNYENNRHPEDDYRGCKKFLNEGSKRKKIIKRLIDRGAITCLIPEELQENEK